MFLAVANLNGENSKISGYVEDKQSQKPLKNVNITLQNTEFGTTTDSEGFFELEITGFKESQKIIFSHVGYIEKVLSISDMKKQKRIQLIPTEIHFGEIRVEGNPEAKYSQEITNEITILHEHEFSSGGYLDAADLIVTKNSVMVDESLSGKKTISVRGANADETIVLYDGIKVNSSFNNIFDLSLLNTSTLSQVDIIRGGNLATFDAIGSAAVINFIPKLEQDYFVRFHQRFGSYDSGDWGVNLYKQLWDFQLFASINEGASSLNYVDEETEDETIDRTSSNITLNTKYSFLIGNSENDLKANYIKSKRGYLNEAYLDSLDKKQDLVTLKYDGDYLDKGKLALAFSSNIESEEHSFSLRNFQNVENDNITVQGEYILPIKTADIFIGYKRDEINSSLDEKFYFNDPTDAELSRSANDISAGFKIKNNKYDGKFDLRSIGFNFNYKMITDDGDSAYAINDKFEHNKTSYMVSSIFDSENEVMRFKTHFNYANDFRLPTPYQLLLSQHFLDEVEESGPFLMENKRSTEIGIDIRSNNEILDWNFSGIFFSNSYDNKYRQIQLSGSPVTFLDNYKSAKINGIEGRIETSFLKKKLRTGVNYSKNMIDDKAAFPFKLESKITANAMFMLKHLTINGIWFNESERTGIIFYPNEGLKEIKLDEFSNIDLHLESNFNLWRTKWFAAFSARNLLGGELIKEGIAIRDQRFYVTLGVEIK